MDAAEMARHVAGVLQRHVKTGQRLTVGLSGGRDSVVLLHVLKQLAPALRFDLAAHHVNHAISPNADRWERFCAGLGAKLGVPVQATRVAVPRRSRTGVEASARALRYAAFKNLTTDYIVLAHHQDDQAETVLLHLLRGAGVRGLSAMPVLRRAGKDAAAPPLLRPLLEVPGAAIEAYALAHHLEWIDDESNDNASLARNFLRLHVLPQLERRFPAYRKSLASAAANLAEASLLLDELAAIDAGQGIRDGKLDGAFLASLSAHRACNLLRFYLYGPGLSMPDQSRLREMLRQILGARPDAQMRILHDGRELRRHRGLIETVDPVPGQAAQIRFRWLGESRVRFPDLGGEMEFSLHIGQGVAVSTIQGVELTLRTRSGGERLRPRAGGPSRTLKNLLQEQAVPPWQRARIPLLFCGDALVCVPGIGVDAAFQCPGGEAGVILAWRAVPTGS